MSFPPHPTVDPITGEYDPRDFVFPDPIPLGGIIFVGIVLCLAVITIIFVIFRVIKYRNHRLIQPRAVGTLIPLQIVTFANIVGFGLSLILGKPAFCYAQDALNLSAAVMGTHYNFNIPVLVYQSDFNAAKLERSHSGEETRVLKILNLISLPFRILYSAILAVLVGGTFFLLIFFADLPGDCNRASQLTVAIFVLFIIVSLFYFLIKLSKVQDPYYMKFENNIGSIANIAQLFLMITYPIFPQMYADWYDHRWVAIFTSCTNLFIDGLFTAMLTFDWFVLRLERLKGNLIPEDQIKEADTLGNIFALSQGMDLFQAVLSNTILSEEFTQFTVKEWCVENVLFYKGVEEFKQVWAQDPKQARMFASSLVQEYVVNGAPLEVNIEHGVRKNIIREVNIEEGLSQSTFDFAQKAIYDLMKKDTFEKWRKTANFKETIQKLVSGRKSNQSDSKGSHNESSRGSTSQNSEMKHKVPERLQ